MAVTLRAISPAVAPTITLVSRGYSCAAPETQAAIPANSSAPAATVGRLKQGWEHDYDQWRQRDLSKRRYVYLWADGVYSQVRMDDKLYLLVLIGSEDTGRKEVLAVVDGYRESEAS